MFSAQSKKVLISGASRGIGMAVLQELSQRGCHIIAPSRTELDLSCEESIRYYLTKFICTRVDILINSAAENIPQKTEQITLQAWDFAFKINHRAAFGLIRYFAPQMAARGSGRISNTSSVLGILAKLGQSIYSATKAGLDSLKSSAAIELCPSGVIVNPFTPGYVNTDLTRRNDTPAENSKIVKSIPIRRIAQSLELTKVAAFLVFKGNTYISGQTIYVDGSFSATPGAPRWDMTRPTPLEWSRPCRTRKGSSVSRGTVAS